jgi:hypothetical protein
MSSLFCPMGQATANPGLRWTASTHTAIVFLIANRAYKLKRAVSFSYLDYSTTALREKFRKAELDLNRRTARPFTFASAPSDAERMAIFFSMTAPSLIG